MGTVILVELVYTGYGNPSLYKLVELVYTGYGNPSLYKLVELVYTGYGKLLLIYNY